MLVSMTQHSVLATCDADFIGSHLSHCLIECGYEGCGIHVFLRDPIAGPAEVPRKDGPMHLEKGSLRRALRLRIVLALVK